MIRRIEDHLYETAGLYERWNYPDPVASGWLKPLVTDDNGNDAIEVYLYEFFGTSTLLGGYLNDCGGRRAGSRA